MRTLNIVVAAALLSGAGVFGASAIVPMECDAEGDGYISDKEARTCTVQRFEELSAGQESLTQEQFGKAFPESENPDQLFTETDQDGDGKISREEWMNWREQGFAGATQGSEGRMSSQDFETWDTGGEVTSQ